MKKLTLIIAIVFSGMLILSSCNREEPVVTHAKEMLQFSADTAGWEIEIININLSTHTEIDLTGRIHDVDISFTVSNEPKIYSAEFYEPYSEKGYFYLIEYEIRSDEDNY